MVVETNSQIQYLMKLVRMLLMSSTVIAITVVFSSCSKEQDMIEATASSAPAKDSITKTATVPTAETSTGNLKSFSFSEIPFGNPDLVNPGRGAEQWHDRTDVDVPSEGAEAPAMDVYYRFVWTRLEGRTPGSYNWSYFDGLVNTAIQKKQKFSFGI